MKKLLVLFLLVILAACSKTVEIPDDAKVALCAQGDVFKYIYKDDTVYEFYNNDVLQDSSMLDIVQNAADAYDDFEGYLDATFMAEVCVITDYSPE